MDGQRGRRGRSEPSRDRWCCKRFRGVERVGVVGLLCSVVVLLPLPSGGRFLYRAAHARCLLSYRRAMTCGAANAEASWSRQRAGAG